MLAESTIILPDNGVLPVSMDVEGYSVPTSGSAIQNFLADVSANGQENSDYAALAALLKTYTEAPTVNKKGDGDIGTMNFTTTEEMWYMNQYYLTFDMFGDNVPSYDLQTVTIVGHRLPEPEWEYHPEINYYEYATVLGGGGGSNAVQIACDIGVQDIDWSFIAAREGALYTTGYHPGTAYPKSGVTIATGFDVGQRSADELWSLGLPTDLTQKLVPYAELKGADAAAVAGGLHISIAEALIIDTVTHTRALAKLTLQYDAAVGIGAFYSLPGDVQTALGDLAFQYNNLPTKAPNTWAAAISKDWNGVYNNLMNYGDGHTTRRQLEAALVKQAIDNNEIHQGSLC